MPKRLLVIDGDGRGRFFLSVEAGTLTLGSDPKNAEAVLRDLRISRIRCEVEVDGDPVVLSNSETTTGKPASGPLLRRKLHPEDSLDIGHSRLRLEAAESLTNRDTVAAADANILPEFPDEAAIEDVPSPAAKAAPPTKKAAELPQKRLAKWLRVIDGADQGRFFPLPEIGTRTIGKSQKSSDIVLHDLYVSRVHCELQIEGDRILVTHVQGDNGTLINGQRITQQELRMGEVLRVGNEYLRLEMGEAPSGPASKVEKDTEPAQLAPEKDALEVVEDGEGIEIVESDEFEVLEDEDGIEVVEEEVEVAELAEAQTLDKGESYGLPHPPVDQLLKLEEQVLGHYQIGPLLGRGQSSIVFRALDIDTNQTVALKVLSPDFPSNDVELQRFVRALKVTPRLQHAHIVVPYGAGKNGSYCWIAREYIEGESVARLVQKLNVRGQFDWTRACRVAVQLGKALQFLHQNRVIHGNITPRNVLIRSSDRTTKLTDLMLNKALEGSRLQKAIRGKKLLAELPYLAPEQTEPHATGVSLTDLYALGAVLYVLLTGQPPITGTSPREIVTRIREGKVVKPTKLQRDIPGPFEAAILIMMARRPEDRFQTAEEMLAVVEPIAGEHNIKA